MAHNVCTVVLKDYTYAQTEIRVRLERPPKCKVKYPDEAFIGAQTKDQVLECRNRWQTGTWQTGRHLSKHRCRCSSTLQTTYNYIHKSYVCSTHIQCIISLHTLSTICIILGCIGVVHTVCMYTYIHTYIHTIRKFARVHSQWQCIPGKGEWPRMILGSLGDGYGNGSMVMGMNTVLMSLHTTCTWLWSHTVRAFIAAFSHAWCSLG